MTELILASASPARKATLASAHIAATIRPTDVDEPAVLADLRATAGVDLGVGDVALALARAKAEACAASLDWTADALVLGCDTMLDLDGSALGKPDSLAQARERIRAQAGRSAVLYTGHWLIDLRTDQAGGTGATLGLAAETIVHFGHFSEDDIDAYVATGEPLQVAGAFTIDGFGGPFITGIEGDHHNVVGLSLPVLRDLLAEVGVPITSLWQIPTG